MKIAIIGYGYVGKAMASFFLRRNEIVVYDPFVFDRSNDSDKTKNFLTDSHDEVNACGLAVICVPTPMSDDGVCDTSIVEETVSWLKTPLILIKSTVPPGTTDMLKGKYGGNIVFSPEYIGEGKYYVPQWKYPDPNDMVSHTFQVFGGDKKDTTRLVDIFIKIMGPHVFFYQTDAKSAEFVKYMENAWGAMKVTFCNEMYEICTALGVDYNTVREGWALDSRVEKMHTAVFPDSRGFGGKCFPKDVNALVGFAKHAGYDAKLIRQVLASNDEFVSKNENRNKLG